MYLISIQRQNWENVERYVYTPNPRNYESSRLVHCQRINTPVNCSSPFSSVSLSLAFTLYPSFTFIAAFCSSNNVVSMKCFSPAKLICRFSFSINSTVTEPNDKMHSRVTNYENEDAPFFQDFVQKLTIYCIVM